ncbi:MAG: DUF4139 domain-containing protein [Candidatus Obscuribacterales bacterium]|nr:DUF4139 domain-containing protein [Candidatus Obscuribacterales bacterium]
MLKSTLVLAVSLMLVSPAIAQEVSDSKSASVTVYNQNFGLVRDERTIQLKNGINYLRFEDVAANIDPTSVSFQSLTAPNSVVVREQNYQYDLINPGTILSKSLGKELKFKQYLVGGGVTELSGKLLNAPESSNGLVLKTADGNIVLNPSGEIRLSELPEGLVGKPSLLWKLETTKAGEHKAEIAYQTTGMNWHCDYVAIADKDDNNIDLTSWVTIDNRSGATYKNAGLKLMAGDVHRVTPPAYARNTMMFKGGAVGGGAPQFTEQSFAEYHLYNLQGKTTLKNNETKQMSLFNAANIPVKKTYVFESNDQVYYGRPATNNGKVNVKIEIVNSEKNALGMPLPKGKVRVYKKDADDALQFIGEDQIDHTPKDEKIRLYIGDAFDIAAERRMVSNQSAGRANGRTIQRQSYELSVRNHKKTEVTVTCVEHASGDWTILNSSQPYTKKDARTFEFAVKVPANGESKVTYEIESRY